MLTIFHLWGAMAVVAVFVIEGTHGWLWGRGT